MGVLSNKISRDTLKPGDHIYAWRNAYLYSHHGIYAGEGNVIHFTRGAGQEVGTGTLLDRVIFSSSTSSNQSQPQCPVCGDQSNESGVISSCLNCFLCGDDLYLFEYGVNPAFFLAKARGGTCTLAPSDPPEDVLHRASFLLENGFGVYNIFKNNCEDFAIYCKTGLLVVTNISVGRSGQATAFVAAISAVVSSPLRFLTTSCSGLAAVGFGMYCVSRFVSDIGVRRDVIKVPVERLVNRSGLDELAEGVVDQCGPVERLVNRCGLDEPAESVVDQCGPVERLVNRCGLDEPAESVVDQCGPVERLVNRCGLDEPAKSVVDQCGPVERLVDRCGLDKPAKSVVDQCDPDKTAETAAIKED